MSQLRNPNASLAILKLQGGLLLLCQPLGLRNLLVQIGLDSIVIIEIARPSRVNGPQQQNAAAAATSIMYSTI